MSIGNNILLKGSKHSTGKILPGIPGYRFPIAFIGIDPFVRLLRKFEGVGDEVGVEGYLDNNGNDHDYLLQHLGNQYYYAIALAYKSPPSGHHIHALEKPQIRRLVKYFDEDDASVAFNGGNWLTGLASASTYGGTYARTSTTDEYVRFTSPDGTTFLGIIPYVNTNAGLVLVKIDGDATLANELLTAQDLVDAGTFPNTILIANGGTLNPTDRVLDLYGVTGLSDGRRVRIASGLTAGVHTLDLICTGYKRAASSGVRLYISAFFVNAPSGSNLSTANIGTVEEQVLQATASAIEYAIPFLSGAATDESYNGNGHGYDDEQTFVIKVDGVPVDLDVYECVGGSLVTVDRTSILYHPDLGATECADIEVDYTLDPTEGLTVEYSITWKVNGIIPVAAYAVMMAFDDLLDTASAYEASADETLLDNDGSFKVEGEYATYYAWDSDGIYAMLVDFDPELSTDDWASDYATAYIEDRVDNNLNKVYVVRANNDDSFSINDMWQSLANYRVQKFIDANAELAR